MQSQKRKHTFEDSIAEVRAAREWDESNWRVVYSHSDLCYKALVPDFTDCIGDNTEYVKTERLQSQDQAERIVGLLNALSGLELQWFIMVLKDAGIWR